MKRWSLIGSTVLVLGVAAGGWHWLHGGSAVQQANRLLAHGDLRGAKLTLRNEVVRRPADARAHYMLAQVELQSGDPLAAEREARAAAQNGYDAAQVQVMLAASVLQQKRYDDVLSLYQPSAGMTPSQAAAILVDRGLAQFGLGQYDAAARTVAQAQARDPVSFEADMAAAKLAQARGDTASAKRQVDAALAVTPDNFEALLLRGELALGAGDQVKALAAYDAAVAHSPGVGMAQLARADLLTTMGRPDDARKDIDTVLKVAPRNPVANLLLARLQMSKGDWTGADSSLDKAAPVLDHFPRGEFYVAMVKSHVNQPQQALDAAERYLANPQGDNVRAAKMVGQLSLATARPQRALMVLQPLLDAGDADAETLRLMADAYQQTGKPEQGLQMLQRAASAAPHDANLLMQLAAARLSMGNPSGAAGDLQQALDAQQVSLEATAGAKAGTTQASQMNTTIALIGAAVRAGDTAKADAALQHLARMPGVDPERLQLLTGLVALAKSDLAGANAAFAAAVRVAPHDPGAKVELARVMAMQGDSSAAMKMLRAENEKEPGNPLVAAALSEMLVAAGQTDDAVKRLETAHAATPGSKELTWALLQLYERLGRTQQALALLDGSEIDQSTPQVLALRAQLQAQNGDVKDAIVQQRQALGKQPGNPMLAMQLAGDLLTSNDVAGARATVADALKANPGNPALLEMSVTIAARQGLPAGLAEADRLAADPANAPAGQVLKGDLLLRSNRDQDALAAYRAAYQAAPSSQIMVRIATTQARSGQPEAGAAQLRAYLSANPSAMDVAEVLSSLDIATKHYSEAADELKTVLSHRPDDVIALNNLAWLDQQANDLPTARALAQRAYLVQPAAQSADTLGWIIFQQGDAKDALPLLEQAASSMRGDATIQYHLAAALDRTGNAAGAVAILKPLAAGSAVFDQKEEAVALLKTLSQH